MDDPPGVQILILASQPEAARRWAAMLQGAQFQVWMAGQETPQDEGPEVIVTDRGPIDRHDCGVVRIEAEAAGPTDPADVQLPADATARELQLACRLLAQIVRLRRADRFRAELQQRLLDEAMTDPLSGLPNRRAWDQAVAKRLPAASTARRLCLAILDLDHFKRINDAYGHAAGDEVLRAAGQAVRDGLRQDDFVARLGGDEFGLLLWVPDEATAAVVVERVRAELPARLSRHGTHAVTASAGYHLAPETASATGLPCCDALFAAADAALRAAKQQGRNRTVGE
jgi:diguanylate cyclase (GGDEF)-like protein